MPGLIQDERTGLVAVALRDKVKASQHNKHGASNAQPEACNENLPHNERLARCEADHDAQAVDDVENHSADREKQRQELNTGRYRHADSHDKAEDTQDDQRNGHIVGKTLLNVLSDGRLVDVLKGTKKIGQTLAPYRLLFLAACGSCGIYFVCFRFRHKPTSLLAGTPSNIIKPSSYP